MHQRLRLGGEIRQQDTPFPKNRHHNCTDVLENIIVKTDGPDVRNVTLELSPAIVNANNSFIDHRSERLSLQAHLFLLVLNQ